MSAVRDEVDTVMRSLPDHPLMGRVVPEFDRTTIRERFVFSYRVICQVNKNDIHVLT